MHTKTFFLLRIFPAIAIFAMVIPGCNQRDINRDNDVAVPVSATEASYESISEFLKTTGTVNAINSADLLNQVDGNYYLQKNPRTQKLFALGDKINKGDTLIQIKNREHELSVQLESKKLELKIAKQEYEKQKALYEKGGVTKREVTNAEKTYLNAQSALEQARININMLTIEAPFTGVITQLPYHTQGSNISANTTLAKLMDYRELIMEVSFPEKTLTKVEAGMPVEVDHYSLESETLKGKLTEISPAVDPTTRMFDAKIKVKNPDKTLRPGMFVKANVMVQNKDSVLTLPREVVLNNNGRKMVYVIERDRARARTVKTGIESGRRVEITEGLEKEERVVTDGYETLRDRSRVEILQ